MAAYLLAIDQGTTSSRALVYDETGRCKGMAGQEFPQYYPQPGWVEHDPEEIWASVAQVVPQAIAQAGINAGELVAIGLTNQRETVVAWDRNTGQAVHRAIVWQDRRTMDFCRQRQGDESWVYQRTGLVIDPYFSATKMRWLLDNDAQLRQKAQAGQLLCGTVDSWLIWKLTGGNCYLTDVSNASRTLLLNVENGKWDEELCHYFGIPPAVLAEIRPSSGDFGVTHGLSFLPDGLPIAGVAGDQQAALFGQCGFSVGDAKCTYGTGAFFLQHTGNQLKRSAHRLLASIAATVDERLEYVLEGSVFVAGAAVQWLRDGLKLFKDASEVEDLAKQSDLVQPVIFIPGFVGLGAPWWTPEVQGTIFGLTRATTAADLGRAALEGVAFEIADLVEAAAKDTEVPLKNLRVDGGMARNDWFLQCQANLLGLPVLQATQSEATALGAAYLAGLRMGIWPDKDTLRQLSPEVRRFDPQLSDQERRKRLDRWHRAVRAVIDFYSAKAPSR